MDVFSIIKAYKTGKSIYSTLRESIESLEAEQRSIYLDIANAQFWAAKDAISAGSNDEDQAALNEAITHLRSAFSLYTSALERRVKTVFLMVFSSSKPFLDYEGALKSLKAQFEIGLLITFIYKQKHDEKNSAVWRERTESSITTYIEAKHYAFSFEWIMLNPDKYKPDLDEFLGDKNDVYYYRTYESKGDYDERVWKITEAGERYLKDLKKRELNKLIGDLNDIYNK